MISPHPTISRREWALAGVIALMVVLMASWPGLVGSSRTPRETTWLGTNVPDVLDSQVYYAFIQANADGHLLYQNQFTPETQPAVLMNPLWWLLGRVTALTHWSPVIVFTWAKALGGILLVLGLYHVIAIFFVEARWRLLGLILAVFGGGLGWLALLGLGAHPGLIWAYQDPGLVTALPVDLTYSTGFVWLSILHSPLYVFSISLLVWIGWATWRSLTDRRWLPLAGAGTLLLGLVHPYDLVLLAGVGTSVVLLGITGNLADQAKVKKILKHFFLIGLWALPAMAYYGWLILFVPAIQAWDKQNVLATSNLRTVLAGFTPSIFFVLVGVRTWWRSDRSRLWVPLAWLAGATALLYAPILHYQAKMIIGLSIPMAILTTAGLRQVWHDPHWRSGLGRSVLGVVSVAIVLTPGFFVARLLQAQQTEGQYFYADNDLLEALRWIKNTTPSEALILGDVWTGNLVPQYARRSTWLGHHHQTSNFPTKLAVVRDWFLEDNNYHAEKTEWLHEQGIDYFIFGPKERRQGTFNPANLPVFHRVYLAGGVTVWAVQPRLGE